VHVQLLTVHQLLSTDHEFLVAGKVTHGIGTIVKVLIGFGIVIGVVIALAVAALVRRK